MPSYHFLKEEVELCTMSNEGFKVLSSKILEAVAENETSYFKEFLKQVSLIITSKYCAPTSRFYALYLLFKASLELKSEFLLEFLKETVLLAFIHHTAQYESTRKISLDERGRGFFTQSPTKGNSRIGINFVRLCLEMLTLWDQKYVNKTPGHPSHLFRLYAKGLSKKLKLPQFYFFIGKSYDLSQDLATWDFSFKFPALARETISSVGHDQIDLKVISKNQEDAQLSCESFEETDNADLQSSFSLQTEGDFNSSPGKTDEKVNSNGEKQDLFEEPLPPFMTVARHLSEPPQMTHQLMSFKIGKEGNELNLEEKIPSFATSARATARNFPTPVSFQITKSKTYERSKLLSDLDEIGMSIKRSMNSSVKVKTSSTIEDNQEKVGSIGSTDDKTSHRETISRPFHASLASLRLATPLKTDENHQAKSSRRHFTFLNKETNGVIPSCSSIWMDKEETVETPVRISRNQSTSNAPFHHPFSTLKKSSSTFAAAAGFLDFESQGLGKAQESTRSTRRDEKISTERKKYDPFLRERLVEPSEVLTQI